MMKIEQSLFAKEMLPNKKYMKQKQYIDQQMI